jgi:hypothetical protein
MLIAESYRDAQSTATTGYHAPAGVCGVKSDSTTAINVYTSQNIGHVRPISILKLNVFDLGPNVAANGSGSANTP